MALSATADTYGEVYERTRHAIIENDAAALEEARWERAWPPEKMPVHDEDGSPAARIAATIMRVVASNP